MKIHTIFLYGCLLAASTSALRDLGCGYDGNKGKEIERQFDECFRERVKESRIKMSLGYDYCFGYDYQKLKELIAEPLELKKRIVNRKLVDLSLKTCAVTEEQQEKENRQSLDKKISNCKHFFNVIIGSMYNTEDPVTDVVKRESKLVRPLLGKPEALRVLTAKVNRIIQPIDACKTPQVEFRLKLTKKYLEMYLNGIVNPGLPSFNDASLPVYQHPEAYIMLNNKFVKTDIQAYLNSKRKKGNYLPEKRVVVIRRRQNREEKGEDKSKKTMYNKLMGLFSKKKNSQKDGNEQGKGSGAKKQKKVDPNRPGTEPDKSVYDLIEDSSGYSPDILEDLEAEDHDHEDHGVVIDDFWDKNLKIKNKRFGRQDFNRYKIKGFDVDRQLKKLFSI